MESAEQDSNVAKTRTQTQSQGQPQGKVGLGNGRPDVPSEIQVDPCSQEKQPSQERRSTPGAADSAMRSRLGDDEDAAGLDKRLEVSEVDEQQ